MKNTSIGERIERIMEHLKMNKEAFSKHLGYKSQEKIGRLLRKDKEKPAMPSFEIIADISNKFEWLNSNWLITGNGDMILETHDADGIVHEEKVKWYNEQLNKKTYAYMELLDNYNKVVIENAKIKEQLEQQRKSDKQTQTATT